MNTEPIEWEMIKLYSCTPAACHALETAVQIAAAADDGYVGTEHLLLGLLSAKTERDTPCIAAKLLSARSITVQSAAAVLGKPLTDVPVPTDPKPFTDRIEAAESLFTPALDRILTRAREEAERFLLEHSDAGAVIGSEHLLFSLLCETDAAAHHVLAQLNLPLHELYGDVLSFLSAVAAEEAIFSGTASADPDADIRQVSRKTDLHRTKDPAAIGDLPYLLDMTACAAAGKYDAVVGREAEEEAVLRILLHRQKNNPCLLGEAGVGKTAIVEGLAARISRGDVPQTLTGAKIYALDLGGMLAGAKYRGEFEERLKQVLSCCREQGSDAILFIDELHMLMGAGAAEGAVDAANLLKPALSRGEIRVIGATTKAEYDKSIGRDGAMSRRFQTVTVEEPDEERAYRMLCALRPRLERHHGVRISDDALRCAVSASVRCLPEFFLPDKAIDLLDDACAAAQTAAVSAVCPTQTAQQRRDAALLSADLAAAQSAVADSKSKTEPVPSAPAVPTVTVSDIFLAAERRTGIIMTNNTDTAARYRSIEEKLNSVIFGQEAAISEIAAVLRRSHAGLSENSRPRASFLFFGPTGVGKTAVCEQLAAFLFDTPHAYLRFDMTEYREPHALSRLIGAPPGYVGHDDGGILTAAVRHRPYALLLFDAIDRAHPDVRQLLGQLLDSGLLTDSRGGSVSFRHTVIIMTADDAPEAHTRPLGFTPAAEKDTALAAFRAVFPAEFLSRFDALIRFRPLDASAAGRILSSRLDALAARLLQRGITVTYDADVIAFLYRHAPPELGAHGLCRTAEQMTEPILAQALLDGTLQPGDVIRFSAGDQSLVLRKEHSNPLTNPH